MTKKRYMLANFNKKKVLSILLVGDKEVTVSRSKPYETTDPIEQSTLDRFVNDWDLSSMEIEDAPESKVVVEVVKPPARPSPKRPPPPKVIKPAPPKQEPAPKVEPPPVKKTPPPEKETVTESPKEVKVEKPKALSTKPPAKKTSKRPSRSKKKGS